MDTDFLRSCLIFVGSSPSQGDIQNCFRDLLIFTRPTKHKLKVTFARGLGLKLFQSPFFLFSRKYLESRLGGGDTVHYLNHYILDCAKKPHNNGRYNMLQSSLSLYLRPCIISQLKVRLHSCAKIFAQD